MVLPSTRPDGLAFNCGPVHWRGKTLYTTFHLLCAEFSYISILLTPKGQWWGRSRLLLLLSQLLLKIWHILIPLSLVRSFLASRWGGTSGATTWLWCISTRLFNLLATRWVVLWSLCRTRKGVIHGRRGNNIGLILSLINPCCQGAISVIVIVSLAWRVVILVDWWAKINLVLLMRRLALLPVHLICKRGLKRIILLYALIWWVKNWTNSGFLGNIVISIYGLVLAKLGGALPRTTFLTLWCSL